MHTSFFLVNFALFEEKKLDPGIFPASGKFCPVIPGYLKVLKIWNPDADPGWIKSEQN